MELDKLLVKIEADLSDLKRGLDKANNQVKNSSSKMSKSMKDFGNTMDRIGKRVLKFGGLFATAFGAFQIKQVIDVGRQIEDLQVRLKALFGTAEEGAKAFDVMVKFAGKVPFSLQDIQQASGNLAVVSKDANELAEILEITGNVAGATGLDFRTTAEQISRSFSSSINSADLFRERGVRSMLGFQAGAEVSISQTIEKFKEVFGKGGQFGNVTADLANTLTGTLSMLQDKLFSFRKAISESFMDEVKKQFGNLNQSLQDSQKQVEKFGKEIGESLAKSVKFFAENIDQIIFGLKALGLFLATAVGVTLGKFIASMNKLGAVLVLTVGFADQIGSALKSLGIELSKNPARAGMNDDLETMRVLGESSTDSLKRLSKSFKEYGDRVGEKNKNELEGNKLLSENLKALQKQQKELEETNKKTKMIIVTEQELKEITNEVNKSFEDAGGQIAEAFGKSVTSGEKFGDSMKEIFRSLLAQIVQTTAQILIIDPLLKSLKNSITGLQTSLPTALGGQGGGNGIAGAVTGGIVQGLLNSGQGTQYAVEGVNVGEQITNATGTVTGIQQPITSYDYTGGMSGMFSDFTSFLGFANGGYTPPNKPYMVGERGAEMFVPRTAGNIVPNNELGGGVNVTQNISFSTGVVPTVRAEVMNLLPAIKQETINAVAETRARGGAFARTFGA